MPVRHALRHALAAALILAAAPASAALAPLYESMREIEAMLGDPRMADAFKNMEPIVSIEMTAQDVWEFRTPSCLVQVTVKNATVEPGLVGPRQFTLEFGEASCK